LTVEVAVTGATGVIGRSVVRTLAGAGHRVRVLVRASADPAVVEQLAARPDVRAVRGDLTDRESWTALLDGAEACVHAALAHVPERYRGGEGGEPTRFADVNVGGSAALAFAARGAGVGRFVFLSSRAVFDGLAVRFPEVIDDDAACRPSSLYGWCKASVESLLSVLAAEGWATSVVRPTGVYGEDPVTRRPAKWAGIVDGALRGRQPPPIGPGRTEIHVDDVAAVVAALLARPQEHVRGLRVNCSDVFVTDAWLRRCADLILAGEDPPAHHLRPTPGTPNVLGHVALDRLGLELRGPRGVVETIRDLLAAAAA
jgi:UDP-glucose 4-epimerase